jgi:hypothetical protein
MANIITDVGGDNMVRMTNARFARQPLPDIFTGWSQLRVALYLAINDSGGNITGTIRFTLGLCAGSTNIPGDATCTHFAGGLLASTPWTRGTGPTRYTGVNTFPSKLVGTTLTTGTTFGGSYWLTGVPQMLFIDITKGSPNYSFRLFFPTASATPSVSDFETQSVAATPAFSNYTYASAQTVAVNEGTDGTFDHSCVWWNQTNPTFDIAYWRVYRLA